MLRGRVSIVILLFGVPGCILWSATQRKIPPDAQLSATATSASEIRVEWEANAADAVLQRADEANPDFIVVADHLRTNSFTDADVRLDTRYTYRLSAAGTVLGEAAVVSFPRAPSNPVAQAKNGIVVDL